MKHLFLKNKRNRVLFSAYEVRRNLCKIIILKRKIPMLFRQAVYRWILNIPRDASITRTRNRCILTKRARSVNRKFGLSRLMFRKFAWQGFLAGVQKSSW